MTEALKRTVRTFLQSFLGTLLASGVLSAANENGVVDRSALKKVGVAALISALVAVVTYVQNALEDAGAVPTLLGPKDSAG